MKKKTSSPKTAESGKLKKALSCWQLYILLIPALIWLIVFAYYPMYGLIIAFKDFKGRMGIMGSPWADPIFKYFKMFFSTSIAMTAIKNTIIIMTSNVGAREIAQDASVGFGTTGEQGLTSSEIKGRAMGELKRLFRPELLNRIDDIVVFQKLSGENLTKIAHLLVDDLRQRLIANGMNIKLTDAAYDKIVAEGTDLTNGARPLRRAIQKLIEDPLSEELLAGEWGEGDTVLCDVADGKFVFSHGTGEIPAPRPAGTLGGDTAPAAPHTGNAAPVSSGVTSGPGGMMQAGSGAL